MANYVKFQRGSQKAYDLLVKNGKIDSNTLYFIYPEDNGTVGKLYMGERLISGGDIVLAAANINDLADVITANVQTNDFLVAKVTTAKDEQGEEITTTIWENKTLTDIAALIKEAMGEIAAPANVFQVIRTAAHADDIAAIQSVIPEGTLLSAGDSAIVKHLISTGLYQHTAYIYDGTVWAAMDGNYSAENVYFNEDMMFTYQFGKYTLTNGNVTVPSAGKSLKELLISAHVDIKDPTKTPPKFSISATSDISQEVGTTYTMPTATATFTDGSYTYGYVDAEGNKVNGTDQKAGITASEIKVTCDQSSDSKTVASANSAKLTLSKDNLKTESMKDLIVKDTSITYTFTGECTYPTSTRTPTNNVGETSNSDTGVQYSPQAGDSWTVEKGTQKTDSCTISGWRKMFMGTVDSTKTNATIDSKLIRSDMNKLVDKQVSTSAEKFTVPTGATKIIVACPKGYVISKCEYFTMSWEEIALFPELNAMVPVADQRGNDTNGNPINPKDYHVYVFTHASPSGFEADTQYRVTLKAKSE